MSNPSGILNTVLASVIAVVERNKTDTILDFKNITTPTFSSNQFQLNIPNIKKPSSYTQTELNSIQDFETELDNATGGLYNRAGTNGKYAFSPNANFNLASSSITAPPTPAQSVAGSVFGVAGTPSVAGTALSANPSISSQVSLSSSEIKRALGKAQSGLDVDIGEREFRDIIRKNPHIARLARRSAEERISTQKDTLELRSALSELLVLDEIQKAVYDTVDGEIPLRIKQRKPLPITQRLVGRPWVRKPVGL
jgi:hypothetical protein